jgi:hypothetical protein
MCTGRSVRRRTYTKIFMLLRNVSACATVSWRVAMCDAEQIALRRPETMVPRMCQEHRAIRYPQTMERHHV